MSTHHEDSKPDFVGRLDGLLQEQNSLIMAQREFIRMQQNMLTRQLPQDGNAKATIPVEAEPAPSLENVQPGEILTSGGGGENEGGGFWARHGFSIVLPVALSLAVLWLLLRTPTEVTELQQQLAAIRKVRELDGVRMQSQLKLEREAVLKNQQALHDNQEELLRTQEVLRKTQEILAARNAAPAAPVTPTTSTINSSAVPASTSVVPSPGDQQVEAQTNLRNLQKAIVANLQELNAVREAYIDASRHLAEARFAIDELEYQSASGEEKKNKQRATSWQDFMPAQATQLIKANKAETDRQRLLEVSRMLEEPISSEPRIMQRMLEDLMKELDAAQKDILMTQNNLTEVQAALTKAQSEQRRLLEQPRSGAQHGKNDAQADSAPR